MPSGLIVLDKPANYTSYDCVHRAKRVSGISRIGHCGTLDPSATGVLILLVGSSTRRQEDMMELQKEYRFRAEFGKQTTTGDREGEIEEQSDFSHVTRSSVEETIRGFRGEQSQTPPRFSALKYKGKPYYKWAREGVVIPILPRTIYLYEFELVSFDLPFWEARVVCSRGTYVRTLAEDVAKRVGTLAVLDALVRERIGHYRREDAMSWDTLNQLDAPGFMNRLQPVEMTAHV